VDARTLLPDPIGGNQSAATTRRANRHTGRACETSAAREPIDGHGGPRRTRRTAAPGQGAAQRVDCDSDRGPHGPRSPRGDASSRALAMQPRRIQCLFRRAL